MHTRIGIFCNGPLTKLNLKEKKSDPKIILKIKLSFVANLHSVWSSCVLQPFLVVKGPPPIKVSRTIVSKILEAPFYW